MGGISREGPGHGVHLVKSIMMSARPSCTSVKVSGVTSLHTWRASATVFRTCSLTICHGNRRILRGGGGAWACSRGSPQGLRSQASLGAECGDMSFLPALGSRGRRISVVLRPSWLLCGNLSHHLLTRKKCCLWMIRACAQSGLGRQGPGSQA